MKITKKVREILKHYESENPGTKRNLALILSSGKLGGTGKMIILPVDQGFEHGPDRSFAINSNAYDPHYEFQLALEGGFNAYSAPLGFLEAGADTFAGSIPLILKMNSSNSILSDKISPDQAITANVKDALRLGCSAVGFTIYPGSNCSLNMMEEIREISQEAKQNGLATVIWSYPRGEGINKEHEASIDTISYAAHIAALLGANIIKVKPPMPTIGDKKVEKIYKESNIQIDTLQQRIEIVHRACFNGKRILLFSGGATKTDHDLLAEITSIAKGGANGSIIGRNMFQRDLHSAKVLANRIINIYKNI